MLGRIPCFASSFRYSLLRYWLPWSEWQINAFGISLFIRAFRNAIKDNILVILVPMACPTKFCYLGLPQLPHTACNPGCSIRWYSSTMRNWVYPTWSVVWFDWAPQGIPVVFPYISFAFRHTKAWYFPASWSSEPHSDTLANLPCAGRLFVNSAI